MEKIEYLNQAYRVDQRINSKIEQIKSLRELATKATSTIVEDKVSSSSRYDKMENAIIKIVDLENEINEDINDLVDLKVEVVKIIKEVKSTEEQMLLELRYLCFKSWEQIAVEMNYTIRHVYRVRDQAIKNLKK